MELEQDIVPLVIRALASDTLMAGPASIEDIDMPRSTNPDQLTRHDLFVESCMFHARMRRVLKKPDVDNLGKAIFDAVLPDDSGVWDIRMTKVWAETGSIEIKETA